MKSLSSLLALLLAAGCAAATAPQAQEITLESLLAEMGDAERLARLDAIPYRSAQASSRDQRSAAPGRPGWFANADWSWFLREEIVAGRREQVMMEDQGPGCVVHFWNTWFAPMDGKLNHSTNGIIRVYLDGAAEPVICATQKELFVDKILAAPPFTETAQPDAPAANQSYNLFLPIPYAKSCKITYESRGKLSTVWNQGEACYYNIDYRRYPAGTPVKSFSRADLAAAAPALQAAAARLAPEAAAIPVRSESLAPGAAAELSFAGPGALRGIRLALPPLAGEELASALRSLEVQLDFDGIPCARVPAAQFFAAGERLVPGHTRMNSCDGRSLSCHWTMPFARDARLRIVNTGAAPLEIGLGARRGDWHWDERSMHFHAASTPALGLEIGAAEGGARELPFARVAGRGRLVGDCLAIVNAPHQKQGDSWWGEGDEKIWVDGEAFPSHFGTGTEDYYGYGHCRPERFFSPFHSQPYGDGNMWPGASRASQSSLNSRIRLLDDIPFQRSLHFDMELWHWKRARVDFTPCCYFYLRPAQIM
ncbi:MAG: hypothetical protein RL095_1984 [Verrucomicrobiota bacterium]|jgi:hypothetical protein